MTRAPFVMGKAQEAVPAQRRDLRHHHRLALHQPADEAAIRRRFHAGDRRERRRGIPGHPRRSGRVRAALAAARRRGRWPRGFFADEIVPVDDAGRQGRADHRRHATSIRAPTPRSKQLAKLKPPFRNPGTVTAGNASGVNDGAAAMILASEDAVKEHGLTPRARVLGMASAGVPPRIMGIGPVPVDAEADGAARPSRSATSTSSSSTRPSPRRRSPCLRQLGLPDDAEHVNPNGGAIALGHPLGMSGARLALTAAHELRRARRQAGRSPRCASASGRACRWRSSASSKEDETWRWSIRRKASRPIRKHLTPGYRSTGQALAVEAADHRAAYAVGIDRPGLRPRRDAGKRQRPDQAGQGRAARRAHHRARPGARRGPPPGAGCAGRALAGQCLRPLCAHRRSASGAARSELHRRGPHHHRQERLLQIHHREARRLSVGQPSQCLAAEPHPLLGVRPLVPVAPGDADVFPGRLPVSVRPDLQFGHRREGAQAHGRRRSISTTPCRTGRWPSAATSCCAAAKRRHSTTTSTDQWPAKIAQTKPTGHNAVANRRPVLRLWPDAEGPRALGPERHL